jgi:integrase
MLLSVFLDTVYVPLRLRGRSDETIRLLRHAVRQFSLWLGHDATLDDLDDLVVSRFLAARAVKLKPLSVSRERSGLCSIWNLAHRRGLVRCAPCVAPELVPERIPRALTTAELGRLWIAAGNATGWVGPIHSGVWFRALLGALFYSGERITALLSVPRDGWRSPWLIVPATCRKGSRKPMSYRLPEEVAGFVSRATSHDGPTVLWWPWTDTALRKRWKVITAAAGLGEGSDVAFHALRRSFASHLEAAGGDAQAGLGHASERTTRQYLDPRITQAETPTPEQRLPRIWEPPSDEPPAIGAA